MGGKQAWTPIFYHVIFQTRTMDMKHRLCIKPSPFQYGMLFKAPRIYYFFVVMFIWWHTYMIRDSATSLYSLKAGNLSIDFNQKENEIIWKRSPFRQT